MTTKDDKEKPRDRSTPPPSPELVEAKKEFEEACVAVDSASKKHDEAFAEIKKTISDPKFRAVRQPTPSQLKLEPPPAKR